MSVKRIHRRLLLVAVYAVAMAWVEAAVVYYLRTLVRRIVPYQPEPLPLWSGLGGVELAREAATLIMLGVVGWLAGETARARAGFFLIAFGLWDLFYYIFLRMICGWPSSVRDWDILFLIPLPWWGPVAAPCLIALLMGLYGLRLIRPGREAGAAGAPGTRFPGLVLAGAGTAAALVLFMKDSLATVLAGQGAAGARQLLPVDFPWGAFLLCLAMMSAPLWEEARRRWSEAAGRGGREDSTGE